MALFNFLPSFGSRKPKHGARKPKARIANRAQLSIESLEERMVMTANSISGYVFADANNNGLYDTGETPIANSSIQLKNSSGTVIGQTITDANGFYQFTTDSTISTVPTILAETATVPTTGTNWTKSLTVNQFNPALGTLTSIDIVNAGTFTSTIKVESLDGAPSTIVATVSGTLTLTGNGISGLIANSAANETFSASAFDGTIDFGGTSGHDFGADSAPGSNSLTLTDPTTLAAYTGAGTVSFSDTALATSSASGAGNLLTQIGTTANAQLEVVYHYIPSNAIKPGNYVIVQTMVPPGYLEGLTSSNGVVLPPSSPPPSIPVVFTGNNAPNNDFGELTPGSLSGSVYVDSNNDGIRETNEAGIGGVTIILTPANGSSAIVSALTAADGSYQFNNLLPGVYAIQETQPANYLEGKDTLGTLGGTSTTDLFSNITVPVGGAGINYNFGELLASSLAGKVYIDSNNNGVLDPSEAGIASVTLTLTGTNDLGTSVSATTTTAANGTYTFNGLRPGTYTIVETQPANFLDGKTTAGSVGGVAGVNQISAIGLPSATNAVSYNFGEVSNGTLAGKVYVDANDNGALDPGEAGIGSVTVLLVGTNDLGTSISAHTTTAADGTYSFSNLRPGTYTVMETQPPNYLDGKSTAGSNGGTAGVNQITSITLPVSATATGYNFGEILPGSLAGFVYIDSNKNDVQDPGEQGLGNVTITLVGINDQNTPISASITTAANGAYSFAGLRPGVYGITAIQPNGYIAGKLGLGSLGGQIGSNQFSSITLQPSQSGVQYDFPERLIVINNSSGNNPFQPINVNLTFLSKLQLLSNSQQIIQEASQLAYYVDGVYSVTLGRHADATGLSYFTLQLLQGGMTQQAFVSYMLSTPEHMASEINTSYLTILGRSADGGGLAYFEGLMNSGVSINDINATLLTSAEFQARFSSNQSFVQGLYQAVLGRTPNAGDLTFWQAQLTGGTQRMIVAEDIVHSSESIADEINLDYLNILGRQADPASLNQWVSMVQNGQITEPQVATALLCSPEFFSRVLAAAGL